MGYLVSGPVGTGKTFLATCFAGEIGIPCVKFLNFRSQWQGVTEANLEKIFNLLKALWPVAVMVDEADAFLGNREASGDSGTSSRVFASIASFMGNTEYRGKIVWFLLTAGPTSLPVDLKRQGRAEEHLALFYPQSDAERDELARIVAKKVKVPHLPSFAALLPKGTQLSGADIEAVLVRSKFRALAAGPRGAHRGRRPGGGGGLRAAQLPAGDRAAEPGRGAGVHQPGAAARGLPDDGARQHHPADPRAEAAARGALRAAAAELLKRAGARHRSGSAARRHRDLPQR